MQRCAWSARPDGYRAFLRCNVAQILLVHRTQSAKFAILVPPAGMTRRTPLSVGDGGAIPPPMSGSPELMVVAWSGPSNTFRTCGLRIPLASEREGIPAAANTTMKKRTSVIRSLLPRRLVLCTLPPRLANKE